jgi:hypothetical protein
MSPIKQSLKGYQAEMARSKPETSKETVEEMQRKAKARAEAWRRQLLADANSVRHFFALVLPRCLSLSSLLCCNRARRRPLSRTAFRLKRSAKLPAS